MAFFFAGAAFALAGGFFLLVPFFLAPVVWRQLCVWTAKGTRRCALTPSGGEVLNQSRYDFLVVVPEIVKALQVVHTVYLLGAGLCAAQGIENTVVVVPAGVVGI